MLDFVCHGDPGCVVEMRIGVVFCAALLAIVFIQSGLDKVFDWSGNIGWLTDHFSETFFAGQVPFMVGLLTVFELAAGVAVGVGGVLLLVTGSETFVLIGFLLCGITFLQLFFGQRVAKDYEGASVIVPYFIVVLAGLALLAGS